MPITHSKSSEASNTTPNKTSIAARLHASDVVCPFMQQECRMLAVPSCAGQHDTPMKLKHQGRKNLIIATSLALT
jgi:hypothetical protein